MQLGSLSSKDFSAFALRTLKRASRGRRDGTARFATDLGAGLASDPKRVAPKYFYDERGSALFEAICEQPEYYPTRTERGLLRQHAAEVAEVVGADACFVDLGSCNTAKARILLEAVRSPRAYVPVDVSAEPLDRASRRLVEDFPSLDVEPLLADFTTMRALPKAATAAGAPTVFLFFGSTIGNFAPEEAAVLLQRLRRLAPRAGVLLGVDLVKEHDVLHRAYNDAAGVTAAFNKNLLVRANRELGTDFDVDRFEHLAFFNPTMSRVEMHLVSRGEQLVHLDGAAYRFENGESLHTECSYKYTPGSFATLAHDGGYAIAERWLDLASPFGVFFLRPEA
jgi:dimethylhistidine N-methyltransferase